MIKGNKRVEYIISIFLLDLEIDSRCFFKNYHLLEKNNIYFILLTVIISSLLSIILFYFSNKFQILLIKKNLYFFQCYEIKWNRIYHNKIKFKRIRTRKNFFTPKNKWYFVLFAKYVYSINDSFFFYITFIIFVNHIYLQLYIAIFPKYIKIFYWQSDYKSINI